MKDERKDEANSSTWTFEGVKVSEPTKSGLAGSGPTGSPKEEPEPEDE